ncbi:MAG TPA: succinylglutamate desuccinylase/aspartoacylase family protein, partial [Turneriella sp.]|nr:succinylglutamate desuccinylase/aspartoacylase family protein [Turneriella sp.]
MYHQKNYLPFESDASDRPWLFPFIRLRGDTPGPKITLIAAIHGDELNGIRMLHRLESLFIEKEIPLKGSICLVPVANLMGYTNHSRYLPDRRDLNCIFPGLREGSEGARLAYFIWSHFVSDADFVIDVHSGSYNRWNFPHVRGDMKNEKMRAYAAQLTGHPILHSAGVVGSLRKEASKLGKPVFLVEAGETGRFEKRVVEEGLTLLLKILAVLGIVNPADVQEFLPNAISTHPHGYYRKAVWQRATHAGLFIPQVEPG